MYWHGDRSLCSSTWRLILWHPVEPFFHLVSSVLILSWILRWCFHGDSSDTVQVPAKFHQSWSLSCNSFPKVRYEYLMLLLLRLRSIDQQKSSPHPIGEPPHLVLLCNLLQPCVFECYRAKYWYTTIILGNCKKCKFLRRNSCL